MQCLPRPTPSTNHLLCATAPRPPSSYWITFLIYCYSQWHLTWSLIQRAWRCKRLRSPCLQREKIFHLFDWMVVPNVTSIVRYINLGTLEDLDIKALSQGKSIGYVYADWVLVHCLVVYCTSSYRTLSDVCVDDALLQTQLSEIHWMILLVQSTKPNIPCKEWFQNSLH